MGMFDEVICEMPLPFEPGQAQPDDSVYQTKDLSCCLTRYKIDEKGRMWEGSRVKLDSDERAWERYHHSGELFFYTQLLRHTGWVEFCAQFKRNKVVSIEQVTYRQPDLKYADERDAKLQELLNPKPTLDPRADPESEQYDPWAVRKQST